MYVLCTYCTWDRYCTLHIPPELHDGASCHSGGRRQPMGKPTSAPRRPTRAVGSRPSPITHHLPTLCPVYSTVHMCHRTPGPAVTCTMYSTVHTVQSLRYHRPCAPRIRRPAHAMRPRAPCQHAPRRPVSSISLASSNRAAVGGLAHGDGWPCTSRRTSRSAPVPPVRGPRRRASSTTE